MRIWRMIRSGAAVFCGGLAVIIVCLSLQRDAQVVADAPAVGQTFSVPGQAYVFRFDPAVESFQTFTVSTVGANPHSVEVVSNTTNLDVWFTEPGADRIGRLIYTNTMDYVFREYAVAEGSMPLNLVADGEHIWFVAHQGNWIGRLAVASGGIMTFPVPTASSRPAGIDVAPDGSVWFTEMAADKIGQLVVTTTTDYAVTEYLITGTGTNVGAYGITVQSNEYIWVGETRTGIVRRLKAADGTFIWTSGLGADGYPHTLVVDPGRDYLWLTERDDNQISQIEVGTLHIANSFNITPTSNTRPTGLTMLGSNQFWFSGQEGGQIGRMVYTSPTKYNFKVFDLPVSGLWAMDIVADKGGYLWTVAYLPRRIFLPLTMRSQ
jgi:virginiamycin B lyase